MKADWIGFEFKDKGSEWEVVAADDAFGEQDSYWWCKRVGGDDAERVSWGVRDLQIKFLEKEVAYERETRRQFYKDIWAIVSPDQRSYDYPAQIIRYTENQRDELKGEIVALREALTHVREIVKRLNDEPVKLPYHRTELLLACDVLDKEWPEQYYIDLKAKQVVGL